MRGVIAAYVVIALGTVPALLVMSMTVPSLATGEAWGHAVIVGALSIVLLFRARAAGRGGVAGLRSVVVIGCVLLVVNLVEAALPGVFPLWMRVEMLVVAALMVVMVGLAGSARRVA